MSNTEWSLLIWFLIIVILIFLSNKTRSSLIDLIKSFFALTRQPALKIFYIYQLLLMSFLLLFIKKYHLDIWFIKDYLITSVSSIAPFMFKSTYRFSINELYKTLLYSFSISSIVSFIIDQYTFSLIAELIIVPIVSLITILIVMANSKPEYKQTSKFLNLILVLIVIGTLSNSIIKLVLHYKDVKTLMFWMNYFSNFIFWALNIPLLFFWQYISQLDTLLICLNKKKTVFSFFVYLLKSRLLFLKNRKRIRNVTLSNIKNIKRGGVMQKFYWITVKKGISVNEMDNIILMIRTNSGPRTIYPKNEKVFPLRIILNYDDYSGIPKEWSDKNLDDYWK